MPQPEQIVLAIMEVIRRRKGVTFFDVSPYGHPTIISLIDLTEGALVWDPSRSHSYVTVHDYVTGVLRYTSFGTFEEAKQVYEMIAHSHGVPASRYMPLADAVSST